jgi:hypothetical protein
MMPTDNTVISESVYCCGDTENRLISLSKDNVQYGLQEISEGNHLLWKYCQDLKTMVYTRSSE